MFAYYVSLKRTVAKSLNNFLRTCPNLGTLRLPVLCPSYKIDGPSLRHPTVKKLEISYPFLSVRSSLPLASAFPGVTNINFRDFDADFFSIECKLHKRTSLSFAEYFKATIGDKMSNVKRLAIRTRLPNREWNSPLAAIAPALPINELVPYFPNIEAFDLSIDPPYTDRPTEACMMVCTSTYRDVEPC